MSRGQDRVVRRGDRLWIDGAEVERTVSFDAASRSVEYAIAGMTEWLDVRRVDDLRDWEIERIQRWLDIRAAASRGAA